MDASSGAGRLLKVTSRVILRAISGTFSWLVIIDSNWTGIEMQALTSRNWREIGQLQDGKFGVGEFGLRLVDQPLRKIAGVGDD